MADTKILRIRDVCERVGLSRSRIYALMQKGMFPKQYKIGVAAVGWRSEDIERWLSELEVA